MAKEREGLKAKAKDADDKSNQAMWVNWVCGVFNSKSFPDNM